MDSEIIKNYSFEPARLEEGGDKLPLNGIFKCYNCGKTALTTKPATIEMVVKQIDEIEGILALHLMSCSKYQEKKNK